MIRKFTDWVAIREDDDASGVGPSLGHAGPGDNSFGGGDDGTEDAWRDIAGLVSRGMKGQVGKTILNAVVSALLNEPQIPDDLQKTLKQRIQQRWASVVDLNDVEHPGLGVGLANYPPVQGGGPDVASATGNVVVPATPDQR